MRSMRQVLAPVALVALVALGLVAAGPAPASPAQEVGGAIAAARAAAARLEREVARLDTEVEVLAEAHATAQARLDRVIQAAHRQKAALERSEQALQATRETFAGDVRDLYARGPLAPLGLLLEARDAHQLALAGGVAGRVLERDRRALAETGLAAGTVRTRVARLEATQAEAVGLRQRLARQAAAIGERLDRRRAVLATARAEVHALVRAERARQEAARRALVAAAAVRVALDQVGKPYRWGASGPESFDCSGLVRWAYAHAGLALPRTSRQQWWAGRPVDVGGLRPGDLVFWATNPADPATIHHVAIYVGQALMVHAPHTGALVRVDPVRPNGYAGATRPGPAGEAARVRLGLGLGGRAAPRDAHGVLPAVGARVVLGEGLAALGAGAADREALLAGPAGAGVGAGALHGTSLGRHLNPRSFAGAARSVAGRRTTPASLPSASVPMQSAESGRTRSSAAAHRSPSPRRGRDSVRPYRGEP
jgi:peptidoglycan DL-endopeptidase CwlO